MKKQRITLVSLSIILLVILFGGCSNAGKAALGSQAPVKEQKTEAFTNKLILEDIKKKYTDAEIKSVRNVGTGYVLVESQQKTFANRFDLYNLQTGQMDALPTMPQYVTLVKAENENCFVFLASGKDSESPFNTFPYLIKCFRTGTDAKGDNFTAIHEDRYFNLEESLQAGSKPGSSMADLVVEFDGFEVLFKPAEGDEGGFYADATDIPPTKTTYDKSKGQLTFEIDTGHLGKNLKTRMNTYKNQYISSYEIIQKGDKTYLVMSLRNTAKAYLPKIKRLPDGEMIDGFPCLSVEFKGED